MVLEVNTNEHLPKRSASTSVGDAVFNVLNSLSSAILGEADSYAGRVCGGSSKASLAFEKLNPRITEEDGAGDGTRTH